MQAAPAPGSVHRDARPPVQVDFAPIPDAEGCLRPSATIRPSIKPELLDDPLGTIGYPPDDPYVRRFWVAVMGPGAVADLLRLMKAAAERRPIRRPHHLAELAREDLVRFRAGRVLVRRTVPPLGAPQVRRLPPGLRAEHAAERWRAGL